MKLNLAIRPFENRDEAAVIDVWLRSRRAAYHFLPTADTLTPERAREILKDVIQPSCLIWVGTHDDEVSSFLTMRGSYIDRMYVDPTEWRKGCGTRLVDFAKTRQPEGLELDTYEENHVARRFYEKQGFRPVKFWLSPPPEIAPSVEYHWRPE